MQNKILNFEPATLSTLTSLTGGNLLNCSISTLALGGVGFTPTQPYVIVKHIRLINVLTTVAAPASLFKGASGAQLTTQAFGFSSTSIPANSYVDWYGQARFDSADYLTGVCWGLSSVSVVINIEGEIGLS